MKQTLLIIFVTAIFASSVLAQTNSCNLQLEVFKFQPDSEAEPVQINKISASLEKGKSKTKVKADLQNELPYFANLPAGNYNAIVSMSGYKTTTKEIELDCTLANEQNVISEVIFLWEGNVKETIKMNGGAFKVIGADAESFDAEPLKTVSAKTAEKMPDSNQFKAVVIEEAQESTISPSDVKKTVNGRAAYLPKPDYPRAAAAVKASGVVQIEVLIDEIGRVIQAKAVSGHPLLRAAAVKAAREAKFGQTRLQGMPVQVLGIVTYNFIP